MCYQMPGWVDLKVRNDFLEAAFKLKLWFEWQKKSGLEKIGEKLILNRRKGHSGTEGRTAVQAWGGGGGLVWQRQHGRMMEMQVWGGL